MSSETPEGLQYLADLDRWKRAIGDFMVSFNECEYFVHRFIVRLVPPHLATLIAEERLDKRSRMAQAAIKDANLPIPVDEIEAVFRLLKGLANYRNILAHNAPMLSVYEGTGPDDLKVAIELTTHKGQGTGLAEIQARALEARSVSGAMASLYQRVCQEAYKAGK